MNLSDCLLMSLLLANDYELDLNKEIVKVITPDREINKGIDFKNLIDDLQIIEAIKWFEK